MRWRGRRESGNIDDRRGGGGGFGFPGFGRGGGGFGGFGMPGGIRMGGGGLGCGSLVLIGLLLFGCGMDPALLGALLSGGGGGGALAPTARQAPREAPRLADDMSRFVAVVLADTEDVWHAAFRAEGRTYEEPRLVLFTGATQSACGTGQSEMGPFYCPLDRQVYMDLAFFDDLARRHGAAGDFAAAYVIAHEVGHHVQNLIGVLEQSHSARQRLPEAEANAISVKTELMADCLAGVFAHHAQATKGVLEQGDLEEAIGAAAAVGDDRIQQQGRGHVAPDTFTHGSSAERVRWFRTGYEAGRIDACDTFRSF